MTAPGVRLLIGIPTVARRCDYVGQTVRLLLARGGSEWGDRARIVLMNAEVPAEGHGGLAGIRDRHGSALARGFLRIVTAPSHPKTPAISDQIERWTSKQVLDAAALMEHCAPLCTHYLHLEDDVVPARDYLTAILRFIEEEERAGGWHALAFYCPRPAEHRRSVDLSQFWGLIGVLFRSCDLPDLIAELRRRRGEAPVDHLVTGYLEARGLELRAHVPSLFEHVGLQSSLPVRVQSNRAWRWAGDRTPVHRFLRRAGRSVHVRWLWWQARRQQEVE